MTSSRPYLVRAIYDWLVDNQMTPYIMVDVHLPEVSVPQQYVEDGKIVLNLSPRAVAGLEMGNRAIEFNARFSGIPHHIYVPINAVKAIYAFENGRGMVFNEDDSDDDPPPISGGAGDAGNLQSPKKPHLRIVK